MREGKGKEKGLCVKSKVADGFHNFLLSNNGFSKTWWVACFSLYISLSTPSFLLIFSPSHSFHPPPSPISILQDPLSAALSLLSLLSLCFSIDALLPKLTEKIKPSKTHLSHLAGMHSTSLYLFRVLFVGFPSLNGFSSWVVVFKRDSCLFFFALGFS